MRAISFVLLFAVTLPMIGCGAPATVFPAPIESSISTVQLTQTPRPTATQIILTPTLTPEPGLRTNGPYFGYFRYAPGFGSTKIQFVLMDADGEGRKAFDLPGDIYYTSPTGTQYVSPDGKWLAFYTGSAGKSNGKIIVSETYDLTLNLLDLTTGEKQIVTPLLSKDYPSNFVEAVKEINDPYIRPKDLQLAFLAIKGASVWSPDGRYLAFAGQMDGLSSDLYLYDMTTKKIQRLSSDNEELQSIRWSPDGKWILQQSLVSTEDREYSIYATATDNSVVRDLGHGFVGDWLSSHEFLEYRFGIERYQLRLVDLNTGKITEIWKGQFGSYKVDPTGTWITIHALSSAIYPEKELPGFYYGSVQLINLKSLERVQYPDRSLGPPERFLHAKDGTVILLPDSARFIGGAILASPDMKYWAEVLNHDVKIYTLDWTLVKEVSIPHQDTKSNDERPLDMQWSPDSSGLFLVYGNFRPSLYLVNIPSGDVNLVEIDLSRVSGKWFNVNQ